MKVIKKYLALCLAFLMAVSVTTGAAAPQAYAADEADWTVFVYLCGSDLESDGGYASEDLYEMLDAEYSENVNLVIQTGGASSWDSVVDPDAIERYVRDEDGIWLADSQPAANMGEEATLESFLAWGLENYPAEHTGLVFWNHGGGSIYGVCFDENNYYDSLSVSEIGEAMENLGAASDRFEFIGFDACLMATFETAAMLAPYANYMYASEETEPGTGWDYTTLLTYLAENPDADGAELGEVQTESYFTCCAEAEGEEDPEITFSIVDLTAIPALAEAFDLVAEEMSESDDYASIARGIYQSDNFGGNNRAEGYTNMVDMADMLRAVSGYVSSADEALDALENAVIYCKNGELHENAGGLALYYPLHIEGSEEVSIFREICPSTHYYALVAGLAENADLTESGEVPEGVEESDTLEVEDVYLDEGGNYTVELSSMDEFAYASCCVYMDDGEGGLIYIGEDDDVLIDYENCVIRDDFDGTWLWIDNGGLDLYLIPVELISQGETMSIYVASVLRNGEETYLQIAYDWEEHEYSILGTWDGVDSDTGMAARNAEPLEDGDVLNFIYSCCAADEEEWTTFTGDDIVVSEDLMIYYDTLIEGDYYYSINLYDIYGNCYGLDYTTFYVDEFGGVSYYY